MINPLVFGRLPHSYCRRSCWMTRGWLISVKHMSASPTWPWSSYVTLRKYLNLSKIIFNLVCLSYVGWLLNVWSSLPLSHIYFLLFRVKWCYSYRKNPQLASWSMLFAVTFASQIISGRAVLYRRSSPNIITSCDFIDWLSGKDEGPK